MSNKLKNIGKLEIIVFVSGTVVMILELIGSRILAPYLGTSIFVWTSLIGLILGALSLGYFLGGYFSKSNPSYNFISLVLVLAGFFIVLITVISDPVLSMSASFGIKLGSIFSTFLLFVIPSILLGMISPYSVRLKIKDVDSSGSAAGNLYAISTIGSIFGTFLAGFYLIPTFGSLNILFGIGLVLIITSFLGLNNKFVYTRFFIIILIFIFFVIGNAINLGQDFLIDTDSSYNHIRVFDAKEAGTNRDVRILMLGSETHSAIYLDDQNAAVRYVRFNRLDQIFNQEINSALVIGGGAYLQPTDLLKRFPNSTIDVVEIDPKVTQIAKDYFAFEQTDQINIYHQDGRIYLNNNKKKYDAIYLDAFLSSYSIPFQLTTIENFERIYDSLTDNGIVLINVISTLDGEKSIFFKSEYKTISKLFSSIYVFPTKDENPDTLQNILVIATKNKTNFTKSDLLKLTSDLEIKNNINNLYQENIDLENIKVLTDNFAPVDYYITKIL